MPREAGELIDWKDERGFGFIRRPEGGPDLFVHIKSIEKTNLRPKAGDVVFFKVAPGKDGRPVAVDVKIEGARPLVRTAPRIWTAMVLTVLLCTAIIMHRLPYWAALIYLIAGTGSYFYYLADKLAANRKGWRTPERKLHLIDLTFGIIGGLIAQHIYHHKIWKTQFVVITGVIAAIHALVLGLAFVGVFEGLT